MIKNLPFLLSSTFESTGGKYYPCEILRCNTNGKLDYFKRDFHIRFAAITQLRNVRKPHGELGRVEWAPCYSFTSLRIIPIVFKTTTHVRTEIRATFRRRGRNSAFRQLFLAFRCRQGGKLTSREGNCCTKFVGSSSCCLSNGGRILRTFGQPF